MSKEDELGQDLLVRRLTYTIALLILLVGLILVLVAHLIPQQPDLWPSILKTIGIALVVSGAVAFLQRYFIVQAQYALIRKDLARIIRDELKSDISIIETCSKLGIRQIYPAWSEFVNRDLPDKLELLRDNLIVVGSALSGFSAQIAGGELHEVIEKKLTEGKKFTFCTIKPDSPAARYRAKELKQKNAVSAFKTSLLTYFNDFLKKYRGKNIEFLTLSEIVPKATFLCIDEERLFVSYYFSSKPRANSWVIETHKGDPLFKKLKDDLDRLIMAATPWSFPQEE